MSTLFAVLFLAGVQSTEDRWVSLLGHWTGSGQLFGQPVIAQLSFEPALEGRFLRLRYEARAEAGALLFRGEGLYRCCEPTAIEGRWADSAGHLYAVSGQFDGATLKTQWGDPAVETGRSSYEPLADGTLRVTDRVLRDGQWQIFAEISYGRDASSDEAP